MSAINLGSVPSVLRGPGGDYYGYVRWRGGQSFQIVPVVDFDGMTDDSVTYASSNELVVRVTGEGLVTAVGSGSAIVTVTSVQDPLLSSSFSVEVIALDSYITGEKAIKLINSMSTDVRLRFAEEQVRRMISIEDNSDNLHTAQLALLSSVI